MRLAYAEVAESPQVHILIYLFLLMLCTFLPSPVDLQCCKYIGRQVTAVTAYYPKTCTVHVCKSKD